MTTSHHNKVVIKADSIKSIDYINHSLVITSGQPSSPPPSISRSGNKWTIDMNCGRHGDSSVAGQFTSISGGAGHVYCPTAWSDKTPGKLNFYFGVRVGFSLSDQTCNVHLYFGQGHVGLRNNWWIGSRNLANGKKRILVALSPPSGNTEQVFTVSGGNSNFALSPWFA